MKKALLHRALPERFHKEPPATVQNTEEYPNLTKSPYQSLPHYDLSSQNTNLVMHPPSHEIRPHSLSPTLTKIFPDLHITPLGCSKQDVFPTEIISNESLPQHQPTINCVEQLMQLKNIEVYIIPGGDSTLECISKSSKSGYEHNLSIPNTVKSPTEDFKHGYSTEETKNSAKPTSPPSTCQNMTPFKSRTNSTTKKSMQRTPRKR